MVPPSFADAVMVCVTTGAGAVVTLMVNVFSYGVVAVKPPAIAAFTVAVPAVAARKVLPLMMAPVPPASATLQTMAQLVALSGKTVPASARSVFTSTVAAFVIVISATGMKVTVF